MLHLYQSNRLEHLASLMTGLIQAVPLSDPFAAEVIMVQSRGMGRWLTLATARANGIAAHIQYVLPAGYAWQLMRRTLPDLPEQSAFAPDTLAWRLMARLPTLRDAVYAPLQHYLAGGERAAFELAGQIADIYDQYLVFRPDWIRAWEAGQRLGLGPDEAWQAALWRELKQAVPGWHRVEMSDSFLAALRPELLPERISLFGIASLAPMYLALVRRLAELTDVCLFLLNPCQEYWGNLLDARGQLQLVGEGFEAEPDHPLLASLGKQGRDFFDLVSETLHDTHVAYQAPEGTSLLARLQRDILQLSPPAASSMAPDDQSIAVHSTHGIMRELEVLKDQLLGFFAADPSLTPADIAVLTPDINQYAPAIEAVFGRRQDAPSLDYSIADRRIETALPLLASFQAVLQLLGSRFDAESVLGLLDCPALTRKFGLQVQDLALIQQWVWQAGIRWGRDSGHKAELDLPAEPMFSWRWGLDRLLLGSVLPVGMAGEQSPLFDGLLPLSLASGSEREVLSRFILLLDTLTAQAALFAEAAAPAVWQQRLTQLFDALFQPEALAEEEAQQLLLSTLATLSQDTEQAGFGQAISLTVLCDWLERRLAQSVAGGFLSGGVTFCAMVPMRSIPFRILCLIGMNDGAYPRDERPVSFDLIAANPRRGDRSRRFDDRYLFLEALLSAREKLYLSFVGQSARSNEPLPPSALVSELMDVLQRMGAEPAQLCVQHPMQPFSVACYDGRAPSLQSFEPVYAEALQTPPQEPTPFACALSAPTIEMLDLQQLIAFWRQPARAWLTDRLALRLKPEASVAPVREPFALGRDERQRLLARTVSARLQDQPPSALRQQLSASGALPSGELGQALLDDTLRQVDRFVAGLPDALRQPALPPLAVSVPLAGLTLTGTLNQLYPEGRRLLVARAAFSTELIELWLTHLLLCASQPAGVAADSALYSLPSSSSSASQALCDATGCYRLPWINGAEAQLARWLDYWQQGQSEPLPFFPRSSLAYAQSLLRTPDEPERAASSAWSKWSPEAYGEHPEQSAAVNALVFRHQEPLQQPLFDSLCRELLLPMVQAFNQIRRAA